MSLPDACCQEFETKVLRNRFNCAAGNQKAARSSQLGLGHVKSSGATSQLVK
jgi:hypothetical protein